jgi:FecR protein
MRKASCLPSLSIVSALLLLCCSAAFGQNREKYVISAKAGGINAVTGQASVHAKGQSDWQQLMITDDLDAGDRVQTASDGRVEILLNPGSYLRVGGNSEVELSDNSLANLEVRLLRGTAIVEATGGDGTELMINISTPHARLAIVRQGLYRLNVVPGDGTELIVRKGRVILGDSHTKVKGGNKVVFSATSVSVAKLTKEEKKSKEKEDVELWSKNRAQTLAKANRRISDQMIYSAFNSFLDPRLAMFGFRNSGIWFYNQRAGCYTFLPFGLGWGSPYGASYSTAVYGGFGGGNTVVRYPSNNWPVNGSNTGTAGAIPGSRGGVASSPASSASPARDTDTGARARKIDMLNNPIRP